MEGDEAVQCDAQRSPVDVLWLQGFEVKSAAPPHCQWIHHMTSDYYRFRARLQLPKSNMREMIT